MVSIERCSMSLFATKLLVQPSLAFPRRTICLRPLLPRVEHVAERRLVRLEAAPLERGNGGAAKRRLDDAGRGQRARERVGGDLDPFRVLEQPAAGRDDL